MRTSCRIDVDTVSCLFSVQPSWFDTYWYSPAGTAGRSRVSALFSRIAVAQTSPRARQADIDARFASGVW